MIKKLTIFLAISTIYGFCSLVLGGGLNNVDPRYSLREYRRFILPNQMKVILVSDPTLRQGAASMTVAVGSMHDPPERFGMAHFLEHMLFLGTEKFPNEGSYQKFISTHDGFSNAYTTEDRTNYHFEIDSNYLEEGLERFSQFFISPLFDQNLMQREMKAVDSEHSKNISNDFRRIFQVKRKAFEKGHPARHFATGTMETLRGISRNDLLSFYQKNYSSNLMMLAVAGPQNLETLQEMVVSRFNKIQNRKLKEKIVSAKFMKKNPNFRLMEIKTIKDTRLLKLVFPLSKTLHYYKSRPLGMIGFLIGHEGSGSLLSLLKRENLATSLSAGGGISNKSFSSFDIDIKLTNKAIKNYKKVIKYFFQYINLLRKTGLPRYIFEEVKLMSKIEYTFAQKQEGTSLVNTFSTLMMYYPMRTLEVSPYIITEYKPRIFDSILYNLTPENMLTILASRNVKTRKKEEFYAVDYSLSYSNPKWIKKWRNSKIVSNLKLPKPNKFLPKRLNILDFKGTLELSHQTILGLENEGISSRVIKRLKSLQGEVWESFNNLLIDISPLAENEKTLRQLLRKHVLAKPQIISENKLRKIWFQQDFRFKTPKAKLIFRIHSPEVYSSPRNAVLSQLYVDSILEGLNEFGYPIRLSGLDFDISVDKKGINIGIDGYSDRILELTKSLTKNLKKITVNEKTFNSLKEVRSKRYQNFLFQQPYQQAYYFRSLLLEGRKYSIMDYEKEIHKIKLHHLKEFVKKIYDRIYVEGFVYGNVDSETVNKYLKEIMNELGGKPLSGAEKHVSTVRQISPGESHIFPRKMRVENSAVLVEYQIGQRSPKLLAQLMLIDGILQPLFYNDLRTKQQLGYIVNSSISLVGKTLGLMFLIQSGEYNTAVLSQRIDNFIKKFYKSLKNISNFEIKKIKESLINRKLQKTNSISNEASRLFTLAFERNAEFDINSKEIKAIENLTHQDLLDLVQKYLLPTSSRKLILSMSGNGHDTGNFNAQEIISISNFSNKYPCPKTCLP